MSIFAEFESKIKNMQPINISFCNTLIHDNTIAFLVSDETFEEIKIFNNDQINYIQKRRDWGEKMITLQFLDKIYFIIFVDTRKDSLANLEEMRKTGHKINQRLNEAKVETLFVNDLINNNELTLAFVEGIVLSTYRFVYFFKKPEEKLVSLRKIEILSQSLTKKDDIEELNNVIENLFEIRNWINLPVSHLNAVDLANKIHELCTVAGCKVEILQKLQIESLKMGGLLAVNKGSIDPPTFTIVEWKPDNAINERPYVLVGKGIVYDTGGLSLKPTADSMDYMKSDMSGAAVVAGTIAAVAKNKLPLYMVALIPATDNRPSGNAYAPGDVVTMMDGTTVEVMNSDAEGRMILADALVYAQRYNPELVIDVATLTGSASMAIGPYALVAMGTASQKIKEAIILAGNKVYERVVEFPLWYEYDDLIKSDIADLKNVGGKFAGAIVGGKFLQRFTNYPWMHFDIAGVAFNKTDDNYRGKGGTGFGVRLLYKFFKDIATLSF